jgi:hypothetical protein
MFRANEMPHKQLMSVGIHTGVCYDYTLATGAQKAMPGKKW